MDERRLRLTMAIHAANAWKISSHTLGRPADEAVIERLARAVDRRSITQRPPDFSTWTIPLITRRSSTRGLPRVSCGRCGLSRPNCSTVNQN